MSLKDIAGELYVNVDVEAYSLTTVLCCCQNYLCTLEIKYPVSRYHHILYCHIRDLFSQDTVADLSSLTVLP